MELVRELSITESMSFKLIAIGCIMVALYVVLSIVESAIRKHHVNEYIIGFNKAYGETNDIKSTMLLLMSSYSPRKKEAKALKQGIYYLEHSVMMDYKTALSYPADIFHNKEINKLHTKCIQEAKTQRILMLEDRLSK